MVTLVSRTASQWPLPAATVALACSGDQLQRAQHRLLALASQCSERIDRLEQAFQQLPAAATFDPFAVVAAAPMASATTAAAPAPRAQGRTRSPADARRPAPMSAGALGRVGAAGLSALQVPRAVTDDGGPGIAAALAGAAAGRSGTVAPAAVPGAGQHHEQADAGAPLLSGWLGTLGNLAGEQVALLMQRHAAPSLAAGLGGAVAAAIAGQGAHGQPVEAQRRREGAGPFVASPGSAEARRPLMHLGQELLQGLNGAFAAQGWSEAQATPARQAGTVSQVIATAPQLLEQLLAQGLGHALGGAIGMPAQPTPLARQTAPRAASRLVGAQAAAASDPGRPQSPDAPAAAALDDLDAGEAVAQQISRLLLDQAWMRGVDLR